MTTSVADVIDRIASGPTGPGVGAFFDLDGTIVQGYTASAFYSDRIKSRDMSPLEFARTLLAAVDGVLGGDPAKIADISFAAWKGRSEDALAEQGERLFLQKIAGTIRPEARALVRAHLKAGHTVAIASSATRAQIDPLARDLGIPNVLCTELAAEDGILTGESGTGMLWGEAKARAVRSFCRANDIDPRDSSAYANGHEDIAFLGSVGSPHALNPHPLLRSAARLYGWPVLTLTEPPNGGLRSRLGTAGLLVGTNAGFGVGAALGMLTRDRRRGGNLGLRSAWTWGWPSPGSNST
jgi:putative phosphoserine phosphatase/1-acylglycerol-3-phosphate O-acyltransferase